MRLYLQQRPTAGEAPKYVQLSLEQDLFGGWLLVRESGTTGARPTVKREQFLARESAIGAFESARDVQVKRGFHVMFAQGLDAPR